MRGSYCLTWPYWLSCAHAALFGTYQVNGQTRLVGTSFGILGINATFDYVIIGGGTSGLTVAKRLAEDPTLSVAVIEGGSFYEIDNGNVSQIPAYYASYSSPDPSSIQPLVDWGIVTVPQPQLNGREIFYSQGKCLGGSSARNYLAYQRGTFGTYRQWADIVGDDNYTFNNLLPYFEKSPHFTPPNYGKRGAGGPVAFNASAFSSLGGPLQVSYPNYWQPLTDYVRTALTRIGLKAIPGFNSGQLFGFAEFTVTVDPHSQTRSSSETSFLQAAIEKSTLQVYKQTLATKIIFSENKTATGVSVVTGGKSYVLSARREVILAAGAFRSPQLLMVSGIGPAATLAQFKVPVLSDLQGVGQNLQDQPFFGLSYRVNVTTQSQLSDNTTFSAQATEAYLQNQTGPLTSAGGLVGFEKLPTPLRTQLSDKTLSALSNFPADWPELELLSLPAASAATNDSDNYASFSIAILTPTSRGNITIGSTDTNDNPLVNPNWLSTSSDQELAVQGFKRARQLAAATGITVGPEYSPGSSTQSDAQILSYIKKTVAPFHHASATCAMGKAEDRNAVVDSHGRVFGVERLRVVDISIFPLLPPGHVQSSVYMLAEKLADDIKNKR